MKLFLWTLGVGRDETVSSSSVSKFADTLLQLYKDGRDNEREFVHIVTEEDVILSVVDLDKRLFDMVVSDGLITNDEEMYELVDFLEKKCQEWIQQRRLDKAIEDIRTWKDLKN